MSRLNLDTHRLALLAAKEDILNRRAAANWAIFAYEKHNELTLLDSGAGGADELAGKFSSSSVMYGLCRVRDPGSGQPCIVLINWVGEQVPESQRQTCAGHLPAVRAFFKEAGLVLSARRPEEVMQEGLHRVLSRLAPAGGAVPGRVPASSSEELVGTNYRKTNPALEIRRTKRDSFWAQAEREEEQRKEEERRRLLEERKRWERERMEEEKREAAERERRFQEKERLIEEQRMEQARLEAEARRKEKARWEQQQREHEEAMRDRFRRSESLEKAVEAAVLVSQRSQDPREFFRQRERSGSASSAQPPLSPLGARPGAPRRPYLRYQRSLTESAFIFRRPEPPASPGDFLQAPSSPRTSEPSSTRAAPPTSLCRPTSLPPASPPGSKPLSPTSPAGTGPLSPALQPRTKALPHISPDGTTTLPPISLAEPGSPPPASPPTAGSPPAATPPRAGSPPAATPPRAGSPLPASPPGAGSPPPASPPTAGSPPAATPPRAGSPLPASPPGAGSPPPASPPTAGSPPAATPPRAGSPLPASPPGAGSPPPASPPTAGSPPAATPPRAGSPLPASPPGAGSPPPASPPTAGSPPAATPPRAGSPLPASPPGAGSPPPASPPGAGSPLPASPPRAGSPSPASPPGAGSPPLLSWPPPTLPSPVSLPPSGPHGAVSPSPPPVPCMPMEEDVPCVAAAALSGPAEGSLLAEPVPVEGPHGSPSAVQPGPLSDPASPSLAGGEPAQRGPVLSSAGVCSLDPGPWPPSSAEPAAPMLAEDPVADGVTPEASPAEPLPAAGHDGLAGQEAGGWLEPAEKADGRGGAQLQLQAAWDPAAGGTAWLSLQGGARQVALEGGEAAVGPSPHTA